ncbi:MAG: ABC transporter ATP-binding protein, partial [Bacillota bacterium]
GIPMILCALGSMIAAVITGFFMAQIAAGLSKRLRGKVFNKVEDFSLEEMGRFSTSSLITRNTNDITQIQLFVAMGLQIAVRSPIMAMGAIFKISASNSAWVITTVVAVAIIVSAIITMFGFTSPKFSKMQKLTDNINRVARENLTGLRVVRAYNAEGFQQGKFDEANDELTKTQLFTSRIMGLASPMMTVVISMLTLSIYWIGATLIDNTVGPLDRLTLFSDMVVFSSYAMQVLMSFAMLSIIMIIFPRANVAAKRVAEVIETEPVIIDGDGVGETETKGKIEFKDVCFKYPDSADNVLEGISFVANKGETVAIIGSTGSGKSTLINLIPRFYDATSGQILVDDIDVKQYTQKELRNKLGYVSQQSVLFSGNVTENISYGDCGREVSQEIIEKSVEIAEGKSFVEGLDGQYEGRVAQGGSNFSGGQKQRLSIARALARQPEVCIFDDSFSALDYKTDRILRGSLKRELQGTTNIIVAQRIGTIKDSDRIIVLDEGKIVGMGTHNQLLDNCKVYREIALSQLSKEELQRG